MAAEPKLNDANLEALCDILGATDSGLTGNEIGRYLRECAIEDPEPTITKRHRLFAALRQRQNRDGCANSVLAFVKRVMDPVRYVGYRDYFDRKRTEVNTVLAFSGLTVTEDGRLLRATAARTLSDAEAAANALRRSLIERKVHPDVITFCRAELLVGAALVDEALALGQAGVPRLAFNSLRSESERSEHTGLMNLIKGLFGAFRNTTAHAPKIHWKITEQDALDILTTVSLIHRRLDTAVRTHVP